MAAKSSDARYDHRDSNIRDLERDIAAFATGGNGGLVLTTGAGGATIYS
jgi:hypothetical protein